jgi:hypothetical protein
MSYILIKDIIKDIYWPAGFYIEDWAPELGCRGASQPWAR